MPLFRAACAAACLAASVPQTDDASVAFLAEHGVPVGSIDPDHDDYADLEPLAELIGDARVVSLGEQTHGDGATFLAKCRLVRFLHERLGFDVLAWESGLYECGRVDRALRAGVPAPEAAALGIFPVWGTSAQVRPVLEHAAASHGRPASPDGSARPLEITGFDCQITSADTVPALRADVERVLAQLELADLDAPMRSAIMEGLDALASRPPTFTPEALDAFVSACEALASALEARGATASRAAGLDVDLSVLPRVLRNKAAFTRMISRMMAPTDDAAQRQRNMREGAAIREERMRENLLWLVQERYPDRRIIVWAASSHMSFGERSIEAMDEAGTWSPLGDGWVPMGEGVREELGADLYSIQFLAHHGEIGSVAGWSRPLEPAPAGSFDDLCHRTGLPYLLVDLRTMPDHPDGAWLRERRVARPRGYAPMRADWSQVCDAFFFTDEMHASTRE